MGNDLVFGICADMHQGLWGVDETWRMEKFVNEARERKAEFIVQLGDFVCPDELGQKTLDVWNSFEGKKYHVLGNHDTEHGGKEVIMNFQGQKEKYYSFDAGNYHFVVLDTNYTKIGNEYIDYKNKDHSGVNFSCYIPPSQLEWLEEDLNKTDKRSFIFTHATLCMGEWTIYNWVEFTNVLWRVNEKVGYNKATMCFSGHDHSDGYLFKGGVHYVAVNSMSKKIIGANYMTDSSNAENIAKEYNNPKWVLPYKDPLYMFVKVKESGLIQMFGKQSEYEGVSPIEVHWDHYASPEIAYREVWMNGIGEL